MRVVRKYAFVALLSARSNVVYLGEVMSRVVFLAVILYIFSQLWRVVFSHCGTERLGDLSLPEMLWYLTIAEAISLSAPRVSASVDLDVRSGTLVSYLQRPLSYPLYSLANNFGERLVRFVLNFFVGASITTVLVGPPQVSWQAAASFALLVPLAFTLDFLACFLIGLGAFWLEDTSGIFLIYARLSMMLGGMLFPLTLFPDGVRNVLEWLPFASIIYAPAKMLIDPSSVQFFSVLSRQILGLAIMSMLVAWLYDRASKRVFVNGG